MLASQDQDQSFKEMDREVEKIQSDVKDMEQKVDKTSSTTGESVGDKESPINFTPKAAPRASSPKKDDEEQESVEGSVGDKQEDPVYATIKKSPGSDSGVRDQNFTPIRRSDSQETVFSPPWDREESEKSVRDRLSNGSGTPSTCSPSGSYETNSEANSTTPFIKSSERTNRFGPRVGDAIRRTGCVVPMTSAAFITLYLATHAALAYVQNKSMFVAFIQNNPKFITVPGIIALSLFAIGIFCAIKQFNNTIEHQIHEEDPDKILKKVLEFQPEDKIIKSVRLEYSNGTISHFRLNTWKSHKGFINIDEKVINRTSKIESVFNDRPVFTALLTGFVVANVALPLGLYAAGGISNVTAFYQGILATNIGLSLLVASSVIALSVLCLGVHYYNKTNCTNLVYPREHINSEKVNEKIVGAVERIKGDALKKNHSQDDKCSSLGITNVVVESHHDLNRVYNIRGI